MGEMALSVLMLYRLLSQEVIKCFLGDGFWIGVGMEAFGLEGVDVGVPGDPVFEDRGGILYPLEIPVVAVEVVIVLQRLEKPVLLQGRQRWHRYLPPLQPLLTLKQQARYTMVRSVYTALHRLLVGTNRLVQTDSALLIQADGARVVLGGVVVGGEVLVTGIVGVGVLLALLLFPDGLPIEDVTVAVVEVSGGVLDVKGVELGHELLVVLDLEGAEEEFDVHVAAGVEVFMDLECDVDEGDEEGVEGHVLLVVCVFFEGLHEEILGHGRVMLGPAFEFKGLENVEVAAEEHEAVDGEGVEGVGDVVEGGGAFVLILDREATIVCENDLQLVVVQVHHLQRLLQHRLLLLQRQLPEHPLVLAAVVHTLPHLHPTLHAAPQLKLIHIHRLVECHLLQTVRSAVLTQPPPHLQAVAQTQSVWCLLQGWRLLQGSLLDGWEGGGF